MSRSSVAVDADQSPNVRRNVTSEVTFSQAPIDFSFQLPNGKITQVPYPFVLVDATRLTDPSRRTLTDAEDCCETNADPLRIFNVGFSYSHLSPLSLLMFGIGVAHDSQGP